MKIQQNSLIEAEDFTFDKGFVSKWGDFASGNRYVQSTISGTASMHTVVEDRPGTYDLAVTYFDETDGVSWSRVKVDGETIDGWSWDAKSGSRNAGSASERVRIIEDVELDDLARITIEGRADGGEPLRIDSIRLMRADSVVKRDDNPAFEGAEGFGAVTKGGSGGIVVKVTNLNDSGKGSLRWALEELDFPRIVVFEVGGLIRLKDQIEVNGDVTVAGQTAPGGVTLTGARLRIVEDDVIVQGLRIRPDDNGGQEPSERDAITIGTSKQTVERVILDSNSFTWSVDENISIWSGARDITISNNIIAEGLRDSIHPEGDHSMGLLIGDHAKRITIADNLFANNFHRNPQLIRADQVEFVNNAVSNWGNNAFHTAVRDVPTRAHVLGNVFVEGEDSSNQAPIRLQGWVGGTKYVIRDNIGPNRDAGDPQSAILGDGSKKGVSYSGTAFKASDVTVQSSSKVLDHVLSTAGARSDAKLDEIDARIVAEVRKGTGDVLDRPKEKLSDVVDASSGPRDRDDDGIPDAHEARLGSDPNVYDPHADADGDGWRNIDQYINDLLVGDGARLPSPSGGGSTPKSVSSGRDVVVQAEDMALVDGFQIVTNGQADGNRMIEAGDDGRQVARTKFDGADGAYDIVVHHWDENDGRSWAEILVNGKQAGAWRWDDDGASAIVNDRSAAEHRIRGIDLEHGDTIMLRGYSDGTEPLRVDYIELDALLG